MILYTDMTEREQMLYRALEKIAAGAQGQRPGFPDFLNKAQISEIASTAIAQFNEDLRIELGVEALEAIEAGAY